MWAPLTLALTSQELSLGDLPWHAMRRQGVEQVWSCLDQDLYDTEDGQLWGS